MITSYVPVYLRFGLFLIVLAEKKSLHYKKCSHLRQPFGHEFLFYLYKYNLLEHKLTFLADMLFGDTFKLQLDMF